MIASSVAEAGLSTDRIVSVVEPPPRSDGSCPASSSYAEKINSGFSHVLHSVEILAQRANDAGFMKHLQ